MKSTKFFSLLIAFMAFSFSLSAQGNDQTWFVTYDAVTVDLFENWNDVGGGGGEDAWTKAHPGMSEAYINRQIEGARKMVKREMWQLLDNI